MHHQIAFQEGNSQSQLCERVPKRCRFFKVSEVSGASIFVVVFFCSSIVF